MSENEIANKVIGLAIEVHKTLGPGLLESAYKYGMLHKLVSSDWTVEKEKPIPLVFDKIKLDCGYRIDLLVENKLVPEIKSVGTIHEIHLAQLLTYMRLGNYKLGLLINFNVVQLKQGIKRVINGYL